MASAGLILAGGRASRMGGQDKALVELAGRPLLAHVVARLQPQAEPLIISANGDPARLAGFGLAILPDESGDFSGPLAGILAAMEHLAQTGSAGLLLSAPTDCPFLPPDLAARLEAAMRETGAAVALASSGGRDHPVVALWSLGLRNALRDALAKGQNGVMAFIGGQPHASVTWPAEPFDPFFNVNTPEDRAEAERIANSEPAAARPPLSTSL
jgi:molybdopterin-guanine dinucleotide biosynthesis protein A